MKHKVVFLQAALDGLEQIVLYNAKDNVTIHDRMMETANKLATYSMMRMLVSDEKIGKHGYRMIGHGKYIMFYKVFESKVVILRILHGPRDYPNLLIASEGNELKD